MKNQSKMKTFLIPFTIVVASIITAESAHVGLRHWMHDIGDLKTNVLSKPQEQVPSLTVCGGPLNGTSGTFTSPGFPNEYPPDVTCNFTIAVPPGFTLVETITANLTGTGDSLTIFQGDTVVATIPPVNGKRKRSINYEQLFEDLFGEDTRNYYDDQDYKDYYYYDGRRKKEPYFYERRKKQAIPAPVTVSIPGNGQLISNVFMSNGSVQTNGFSATFTVERDTDGIRADGSETDNGGNTSVSGGSSGGSSDEEEY